MPGCVLRVYGPDFDPREFLASASLEPYEVFRRGDPRFPDSPNPEHRIHTSGGFKCDVSSDGHHLRSEIEDAIAFLKQHRRDLGKLKHEPAIEGKWLDFGYYCRLHPDTVWMQGEFLPIELIKLCAELEIEIGLSLYPPPLEDEEAAELVG